MRLNFFDLGAYDGMESKIVLDIIKELDIKNYRIYVFEPCRQSFDKIKSLLHNNENVVLINAGISDKNEIGKLFHSFHGNEVGHSIFSSKNNVFENDFEEIQLIKFSDWCIKNNVEIENSLNILKFNIEGAEWHLINDLLDSNLLQHFKIFCGDGLDIYKISELKKFTDEYLEKLKNNNINIIPFSCQGFETEMPRVLKEKEVLKNKIYKEYENMQSN
jgi:FkbM family methyltransferase